MPGSFRFRWQGDSAVGAEGWQTSFQFTTTQANGRHFQHIADCDVSLEEHRGTAVVATVGETVQHSIEFAW
ncbi:MAG: hypothetical protein ACR2QH_16520 [Geminicoccaceae bacterium]